MSDVRYPDVNVELVGEDGNSFSVIGRVTRALKQAGHNAAVKEFREEAMSGDYDHLLRTVLEYVTVEDSEDDLDWDDGDDY